MVRLEASREQEKELAELYFNSTMVRLEAILIYVGRCRLFSFQFHYGTIRSLHGVTFCPG